VILHLRPSPNRVAGDLEEPDTPVSIILRGSRGRMVNERLLRGCRANNSQQSRGIIFLTGRLIFLCGDAGLQIGCGARQGLRRPGAQQGCAVGEGEMGDLGSF